MYLLASQQLVYSIMPDSSDITTLPPTQQLMLVILSNYWLFSPTMLKGKNFNDSCKQAKNVVVVISLTHSL